MRPDQTKYNVQYLAMHLIRQVTNIINLVQLQCDCTGAAASHTSTLGRQTQAVASLLALGPERGVLPCTRDAGARRAYSRGP